MPDYKVRLRGSGNNNVDTYTGVEIEVQGGALFIQDYFENILVAFGPGAWRSFWPVEGNKGCADE